MRLVAPSQNIRLHFCIVHDHMRLAAQAVAALEFTDQGRVLVSGGGDAIVHAWLLAEVLDIEAAPTVGCPPSPPLLRSSAILLVLVWAGMSTAERKATGGQTDAGTVGERDALLAFSHNS